MSSSSEDDLPSISVRLGVKVGRVSAAPGLHTVAARPVNESPPERMKRKREEALERREAREKGKQARAEEKEEKRQRKDIDKVVKAAAKEGQKENRPGERLKRMIVILDSTLLHNQEFMETFTPAVKTFSMDYRSSDSEPGFVRWKRVMTERVLDEHARVVEQVSEVDENELLVILQAQGFVGLVHHSKQDLVGQSLPPGAVTLEQYVEGLSRDNPGVRISLAVEGTEAFLRGHKTRVNRQFRQAVLDAAGGGGESSSHAPRKGQKKVPTEGMFSDVSRVECEEALVRLQLRTGCVVHMFEEGEQLAEHVVTLTKALSDAHYQREYPFSFFVDSGQGPSRKELDKTDNKVALIWKHQLMQFNNLSQNMAAAVVSVYPSPSHLLQAYDECSDSTEAEVLLKDIVIRRGVGVTSTSRKLGPVLSKRICTMMTSDDPQLKLT